jgi:hypothetical protein
VTPDPSPLAPPRARTRTPPKMGGGSSSALGGSRTPPNPNPASSGGSVSGGVPPIGGLTEAGVLGLACNREGRASSPALPLQGSVRLTPAASRTSASKSAEGQNLANSPLVWSINGRHCRETPSVKVGRGSSFTMGLQDKRALLDQRQRFSWICSVCTLRFSFLFLHCCQVQVPLG